MFPDSGDNSGFYQKYLGQKEIIHCFWEKWSIVLSVVSLKIYGGKSNFTFLNISWTYQKWHF